MVRMASILVSHVLAEIDGSIGHEQGLRTSIRCRGSDSTISKIARRPVHEQAAHTAFVALLPMQPSSGALVLESDIHSTGTLHGINRHEFLNFKRTRAPSQTSSSSGKSAVTAL